MNLVRRLSLAIALVTAIGTRAQSQSMPGPGRPTAGVFAGATFPMGDFKDEVGTGWHAGALAKMRVYGAFDLRADGAYTKFGKKDIVGSAAVVTTDANVQYFTIDGVANLAPDSASYPGDKTNAPYIIGGWGRYRMEFKAVCAESEAGSSACTGFTDPEVKSYSGVNVGAGVSIPLAGLRSFVEIRYHRISRPLNDGGTRSMFTASAGLKIR